MKSLDSVDDRTIEQIRADGDDRWPDGRPYIVRGLCAVCEQPPDEEHTCLMKLSKPRACGICLRMTGQWIGPASWLLNHTSTCDACVLGIAKERNGEWLLPALVDIAERNAGQMVKLDAPVPCEMHLLVQEEQKCTGLAYWRTSGFAECDECIVNCLECLPDNREWLEPALADIAARK